MGRWLTRLAERRAHGNTAETDETRAAEGVSSVSAVTARASAPTSEDMTVDPFLRWRRENAERLIADDLARGRDPGGFCITHGRALS